MKDIKEHENSSSNVHNKVKICTKLDRGRWKIEEHELFLQGVELFGKDWKKIEDLVGTRTGPQIRSHAQKYFNKLKKDSGCSNVSDSTPKNLDSSLSLWMCDTSLKKTRSTSITNKRKLKEEDKLKETRSMLENLNFLKSVESHSDISEKPNMLRSNFVSQPITPLQSQEYQNIRNSKDFSKINDACETQENDKMYNEEEVLMLIKFIIKEFANVLSKYFDSQQSLSLSNLGGLNINSSLLLSLLTAEQNKMNFTSSIPNIMNRNTSMESMFSQQYSQSFNLNSLLRNQPPKQNENIYLSENLLQIPKMST